MKSKSTAAFLAFFLGGFGGHKIYMGKPLQGILMLLFFWTFIPLIIATIDFFRLVFMSEDHFQSLCR